MSSGAYGVPEALLTTAPGTRRRALARATAAAIALALGVTASEVPMVSDYSTSALAALGNGIAAVSSTLQSAARHTAAPSPTAAANAAASAPLVVLTVAPKIGSVGTGVTVSGSGFASGNQFQLTWDGAAIGTPVTATANGAFQSRVVVPATNVGAHSVGAAALESAPGQGTGRKLALGAQLAAAVFTVVAMGTPTKAPA